jgi:hypothetical protein
VYTPFHAKYLADELTKRVSADSAEKLSQSLCNATVDLNPHQIEAALFAFRSPLSRGAILADEVGLGKTIEAVLIISQLWAERKRRVLCIVPAALSKQWNRELSEKFFIESTRPRTICFFVAVNDGGQPLDRDTCGNLFQVPARVGETVQLPADAHHALEAQLAVERRTLLGEAMVPNQHYFEAEMHKLDLWPEDLKENLEWEIKEIGPPDR